MSSLLHYRLPQVWAIHNALLCLIKQLICILVLILPMVLILRYINYIYPDVGVYMNIT